MVGQCYAIKKVRFSRNQRQEVMEEAKALASLNNKNIVKYFHAWIEECDENDGTGDPDSSDKSESNKDNGDPDSSDESESNKDNGDPDSSDESESNKDNSFQSTGLSLNVREQDSSGGVQFVPDKSVWSILYIKMELCTSTLESWIAIKNKIISGTGQPEYHGRVNDILRQILLALEHIHGQRFIHRDLKPGNIFIIQHGDTLMIKIGDFGLCTLTQIQTPNPSRGVGTFPYIAPELFTLQDYNEKVDIYSLGVIYLELLVPIITKQELVHIVNMVLRGQLPEELQEWSTHVGLLRQMLQKGAEDRSSATELLRSLNMSQPCSDERVAFLERDSAHKDAKIKNYRQKLQNAEEPELQRKKLRLYKKKMLSEDTIGDSTKDFQRALKRKGEEKKKVRSRHSSGQTAQAAPLRM